MQCPGFPTCQSGALTHRSTSPTTSSHLTSQEAGKAGGSAHEVMASSGHEVLSQFHQPEGQSLGAKYSNPLKAWLMSSFYIGSFFKSWR